MVPKVYQPQPLGWQQLVEVEQLPVLHSYHLILEISILQVSPPLCYIDSSLVTLEIFLGFVSVSSHFGSFVFGNEVTKILRNCLFIFNFLLPILP